MLLQNVISWKLWKGHVLLCTWSIHGMISIKDSEDYQASRGEGFQQAGEESSANSEKSNKMTVEKLMEAYEKCIPGLRKSQAKRRSLSLRKIAPASFSKEARLEVPESVIQKMLSLNNLDVELYQHAQHLFMQQQKQLQNDGVKIEHLSVQGARQIGHILYGWGSTKLLLLGLMTLTVVFTSMIVTKKRRMSKLKAFIKWIFLQNPTDKFVNRVGKPTGSPFPARTIRPSDCAPPPNLAIDNQPPLLSSTAALLLFYWLLSRIVPFLRCLGSSLQVASQLAGDTASQGNGLALSSIPDIAIPDMFGQSAFDLKGQRKGLKFWLSISISVQFLKIDFL
ncbi:hypothetical protein HPP92_008438 [Vanilla planifolia]|uniref:Uncharacterized protein n=1 Tax=Vanilla planifolia TaxID=51239 RepID=A0A835R9N7_VANPL|nr:hypothetical protein HPP92_008438 [Vanilla planifolia]